MSTPNSNAPVPAPPGTDFPGKTLGIVGLIVAIFANLIGLIISAIALSQSTVFAFNLFDEAWILAGSSLDTRTVIIQVYMSAFQNLKFSLGMALSVLAMIASLLVSLIYVLRVYRETRYE